ncbi:O-antigen ligase family protein [Patescibacteria group bacterium]|nr:O-antigen ligase family protein [Patescibacteria group bacterium]
MNKINYSHFLDKIIEINWLIIFAFCPLWISFICYSDFVISQYFSFLFLTELLLFFCLIKVILTPKIFSQKESKQEKREKQRNKIKKIIPAFLFILILGIATLFSQSFNYSWWGSYSRKMGYLTWLHFFVFFLILFFKVKNRKQIQRIFKAILFSSLIIIIYGFCQFTGFDFVEWGEPPSQTFRIFSTIGQPNFLGSWLLLSLPIIVYFFICSLFKLKKDRGFKQQIKTGLITGLFFSAIFSLTLTQSRGAWVGLFFAFFFFSIIYNFLQNQKRLAWLLLILFSIVLVFGAYVNLSPYQLRKGNSDFFLLSRLQGFINLKDSATAQTRIDDWRSSGDLIKQRPWLGYGPETQLLLFPQYYLPESALLEKINTFTDRAHNDFLDTLLTSGIFGLISYLFLIGFVFWQGLKHLFKKKFELSLLLLLTGIFGYLISLQFSFHVVPLALYFWGYLALVLKISHLSTENQSTIDN